MREKRGEPAACCSRRGQGGGTNRSEGVRAQEGEGAKG